MTNNNLNIHMESVSKTVREHSASKIKQQGSAKNGFHTSFLSSVKLARSSYSHQDFKITY